MPLVVHPLPDGFVKEFVSNRSGVSGKFASNPRKNGTPMLLIASDSGTVRALENPDEADEAITMLDLRFEDNEICTNGERGLQSVAIDPNFDENYFIYVFYTSYREVRMKFIGLELGEEKVSCILYSLILTLIFFEKNLFLG